MSQIRKTQSKKKIRETLLILLEEKTFDRISVADITRLAGVSRGTFYLHYIDKFDLIEQIVLEVKQRLFQILLDNQEENQVVLLKVLLLIKEEKRLFSILGNSSAVSISKEIENFMMELFSRSNNFQENIQNQTIIEKNYLQASFSASITAVIMRWLEKDCQDDTMLISQILGDICALYFSW